MTIRGGWAWAVVIALIVSVSLNLFVAAAVGTAIRMRDAGGYGAQGAWAQQLPPEARWRLGRELLIGPGNVRGEMIALGEARRAMVEAMRAEPYDAAAVKAAMTEIRRLSGAIHRAAHGALLRTLGDLDAETRARIRMPDRQGRFGQRWHERRRDPLGDEDAPN